MAITEMINDGQMKITHEGVEHVLPNSLICVVADEIRSSFAQKDGYEALQTIEINKAIALFEQDSTCKISTEDANGILAMLGGERIVEHGDDSAKFTAYMGLLLARKCVSK